MAYFLVRDPQQREEHLQYESSHIVVCMMFSAFPTHLVFGVKVATTAAGRDSSNKYIFYSAKKRAAIGMIWQQSKSRDDTMKLFNKYFYCYLTSWGCVESLLHLSFFYDIRMLTIFHSRLKKGQKIDARGTTPRRDQHEKVAK